MQIPDIGEYVCKSEKGLITIQPPNRSKSGKNKKLRV